ncbi:MAG: SemiSWEET transporter [Myxococcota bacterium]
MTPAAATAIGTIAAVLTTASFIPQVVRVLRQRETAGISLWMYGLFTVGVGLWLVYGWLIESAPVVIANAITFVLAASVLGATAYLRARSKRDTPPR